MKFFLRLTEVEQVPDIVAKVLRSDDLYLQVATGKKFAEEAKVMDFMRAGAIYVCLGDEWEQPDEAERFKDRR